MVSRGAWLVPTINVSRATEFFARIGALPGMVERALAAGELHWAGLRIAIAAGVRIAMGTDMMPHEPFDGTTVTVRELEFYVEAGMEPAQALRSATINGADLLERPLLGRVVPGAVADLIVISGDPLQDIRALRELTHVVARGKLVAGPELRLDG